MRSSFQAPRFWAAKVAHAVGQGGKGGDNQVVELHSGGVAGNDAGAKAVDDALDDDIAHGHEALLQDTGHGNAGNAAEHGEGESRSAANGFNAAQPKQHDDHGQYAADALAEEGGPGNTGHTHLEGRDEENVHGDVGGGGGGQEVEGRLGIAQGGEDAGGQIVEEEEGEAVEIDVQVDEAVGHEFLGGLDELQELPSQQKSQCHEYKADDAAADGGGGDGSFHLPIFLGAKELRDDD